MRTYSPKPDDITRAWHIVDADGLVLGRLATEIAAVLRGKHKPTFAPHVDTGDHVIVVNADKVVLTSGKADLKMAYRHCGLPGRPDRHQLRRPDGRPGRRRRPQRHPRHAAEEPPRPPDGHQAQGLPRARSTLTPPSPRSRWTSPGPPQASARSGA